MNCSTQTQIDVQGNPQDAFEVYADETKEQTIAFCFDESMACLIAAAPDLLAALRMTLREWYPRIDGCAKPDCGLCIRRKKEMKQVEAAIKKAESEV